MRSPRGLLTWLDRAPPPWNVVSTSDRQTLGAHRRETPNLPPTTRLSQSKNRGALLAQRPMMDRHCCRSYTRRRQSNLPSLPLDVTISLMRHRFRAGSMQHLMLRRAIPKAPTEDSAYPGCEEQRRVVTVRLNSEKCVRPINLVYSIIPNFNVYVVCLRSRAERSSVCQACPSSLRCDH